jgi:hypothetical protein
MREEDNNSKKELDDGHVMAGRSTSNKMHEVDFIPGEVR